MNKHREQFTGGALAALALAALASLALALGWAPALEAQAPKKLSMSIVHADDSVMHIAAKRWGELIK